MKSHERAIADAVASLTARLTTWGVEEPAQKAHEYVNDMLRNGWRPRALPAISPLPPGPISAPTDEYRRARAQARCAEHNQEDR